MLAARRKLGWLWTEANSRVLFRGIPDSAFSEDGDLTDDQIMTFHRRAELLWPTVAVGFAAVAGVATIFHDVGGNVSDSFMPAVAQVLPVLLVAQIVESGFHARRLSTELGPAHQGIVDRYVRLSAAFTFWTFIIGESAALYSTAKGATTLCVVLALGIGLVQATDLTFSIGIRGGRDLSLPKMVALQELQKANRATKQRGNLGA